jgi:Type II CAAX prenyl endopeptidase Rce1-like
MIAAVHRRTSGVVPALAVAAAAVFLLARPGLRGTPHEAIALLGGYALIAATAAIAPVPGAIGSPTLPRSVVLVLGLGAVAAAAAAAGHPIPSATTLLAPVMNLVAAVAEEAVFRRLAYAWLLRWGVAVAVGATAVAFAVVHVPVYGLEALPVDLGAGLLLSWQRAACGTWTVPATTHVAANLLTVIA